MTRSDVCPVEIEAAADEARAATRSEDVVAVPDAAAAAAAAAAAGEQRARGAGDGPPAPSNAALRERRSAHKVGASLPVYGPLRADSAAGRSPSAWCRGPCAMKLDANVLKYLSKDDFRTLTAVEMGMRNVRGPLPCVPPAVPPRSGLA
eukprot:scaffold382_cov380-Prasinococcus_capsulatus_cf.AAC.30